MDSFIFTPTIKSLLTNPPSIEVWINVIKYKLFSRRLLLNYFPLSIVIYVNKRCNFKCNFCFTKEDLGKPDWKDYELSKDQFNKILNSSFGKKALRVGFLGGEPFLNPLLFEFLTAANNKGKITTIVTNASLVKDNEKKSLLKTYPTLLGISLYDNNVEDVKNLSHWLYSNNKKFWVQTVVSADQIDNIPEIIKFASQNNINNLIISNYNPVSTQEITKVIFDDNEIFKSKINDFKNLAKAFKINLTLPQPISKKQTFRSCKMAFSYIHLDAKGTIGACCFRPPEQKYGNIFDKNSWNNSNHQSLRNTFLDQSIEPKLKCKYCENFTRDLYGL